MSVSLDAALKGFSTFSTEAQKTRDVLLKQKLSGEIGSTLGAIWGQQTNHGMLRNNTGLTSELRNEYNRSFTGLTMTDVPSSTRYDYQTYYLPEVNPFENALEADLAPGSQRYLLGATATNGSSFNYSPVDFRNTLFPRNSQGPPPIIPAYLQTGEGRLFSSQLGPHDLRIEKPVRAFSAPLQYSLLFGQDLVSAENKKVDLRKKENRELGALGDSYIAQVDALNALRAKESQYLRLIDGLEGPEKQKVDSELVITRKQLKNRTKAFELEQKLAKANITADGIYGELAQATQLPSEYEQTLSTNAAASRQEHAVQLINARISTAAKDEGMIALGKIITRLRRYLALIQNTDVRKFAGHEKAVLGILQQLHDKKVLSAAAVNVAETIDGNYGKLLVPTYDLSVSELKKLTTSIQIEEKKNRGVGFPDYEAEKQQTENLWHAASIILGGWDSLIKVIQQKWPETMQALGLTSVIGPATPALPSPGGPTLPSLTGSSGSTITTTTTSSSGSTSSSSSSGPASGSSSISPGSAPSSSSSSSGSVLSSSNSSSIPDPTLVLATPVKPLGPLLAGNRKSTDGKHATVKKGTPTDTVAGTSLTLPSAAATVSLTARIVAAGKGLASAMSTPASAVAGLSRTTAGYILAGAVSAYSNAAVTLQDSPTADAALPDFHTVASIFQGDDDSDSTSSGSSSGNPRFRARTTSSNDSSSSSSNSARSTDSAKRSPFQVPGASPFVSRRPSPNNTVLNQTVFDVATRFTSPPIGVPSPVNLSFMQQASPIPQPRASSSSQQIDQTVRSLDFTGVQNPPIVNPQITNSANNGLTQVAVTTDSTVPLDSAPDNGFDPSAPSLLTPKKPRTVIDLVADSPGHANPSTAMEIAEVGDVTVEELMDLVQSDIEVKLIQGVSEAAKELWFSYQRMERTRARINTVQRATGEDFLLLLPKLKELFGEGFELKETQTAMHDMLVIFQEQVLPLLEEVYVHHVERRNKYDLIYTNGAMEIERLRPGVKLDRDDDEKLDELGSLLGSHVHSMKSAKEDFKDTETQRSTALSDISEQSSDFVCSALHISDIADSPVLAKLLIVATETLDEPTVASALGTFLKEIVHNMTTTQTFNDLRRQIRKGAPNNLTVEAFQVASADIKYRSVVSSRSVAFTYLVKMCGGLAAASPRVVTARTNGTTKQMVNAIKIFDAQIKGYLDANNPITPIKHKEVDTKFPTEIDAPFRPGLFNAAFPQGASNKRRAAPRVSSLILLGKKRATAAREKKAVEAEEEEEGSAGSNMFSSLNTSISSASPSKKRPGVSTTAMPNKKGKIVGAHTERSSRSRSRSASMQRDVTTVSARKVKSPAAKVKPAAKTKPATAAAAAVEPSTASRSRAGPRTRSVSTARELAPIPEAHVTGQNPRGGIAHHNFAVGGKLMANDVVRANETLTAMANDVNGGTRGFEFRFMNKQTSLFDLYVVSTNSPRDFTTTKLTPNQASELDTVIMNVIDLIDSALLLTDLPPRLLTGEYTSVDYGNMKQATLLFTLLFAVCRNFNTYPLIDGFMDMLEDSLTIQLKPLLDMVIINPSPLVFMCPGPPSRI